MSQFTSPEQLAAYAQKKMLARKKEKKSTTPLIKPRISPTQQRGQDYEQRAADYLYHHGLTILIKNLASRYGEIDIVARSAEHLIFVEVRQRNNNAHGGAIYSVQRNKQLRIKRTAQYFLPRLCQHYFNNKIPFCRFDVVAIEGDTIIWIPDAFN